MKKLLCISSLLLLLTGCVTSPPKVLQYDSAEYAIVSEIKVAAVAAKSSCGDFKIIQNINDLKSKTNRAKIFTEYPSANIEIYNSLVEIDGMVMELRQRYDQSPPSISYCQLKLDNVITATDLIRKHLAARRTANGINF